MPNKFFLKYVGGKCDGRYYKRKMTISWWRYFLTYGILFLILTAGWCWRIPLLQHITTLHTTATQQANTRILGYQTPAFPFLAQALATQATLSPADVTDRLANKNFLGFFTLASRLFPEQFDMFYMKGLCHYYAHDTPAAQEALTHSLKLNPHFVYTLYNLGVIHLQQQHYQEAFNYFMQARQSSLENTYQTIFSTTSFVMILRFMPDPNQFIVSRSQVITQHITLALTWLMNLTTSPEIIHQPPALNVVIL